MASTAKRKMPPGTKAPLNVQAGIKSADFAGQDGGAPSTSKRTRFNPDPEDVGEGEGDLDMQEQDRKRLQQGRRGRVNTDGYDSDSSVEGGSDVEAGSDAEKKDNGKVAGVDEDDEDMFNMHEDGKEAGGTQGKIKKKYLDLKDIEGQEFDSDGGDRAEIVDPGFELESDGENEAAKAEGDSGKERTLHDPEATVQPLAGKKGKHSKVDGEDMGFELDSFNVKNEMATGRFDEEGNYIENKNVDPHAANDVWLKGHYSRKSIKAAKEAQARRAREAREREQGQEKEYFDEDECKMRLAALMQRGETVLQTLQRLGVEAKKIGESSNSVKQRKTSAKGRSDVDDDGKGKSKITNGVDSQNSEVTVKLKADLDSVTSMSSELMSRHGLTSIYDATYESLRDDVRKSGLVRATWDPAPAHATDQAQNGSHEANSASSSFVYRWSPSYLAAMAASDPQAQTNGAAAEQVFGPFSSTDLQSWHKAGYFGESGERVLLRAASGASSASWRSWQDIFG